MRICHITSLHSRYDVRIFNKECRYLSRDGNDVALIVNDEFDDEILDGVHIYSTHSKKRSGLKKLLYSTIVRNPILKLAKKVDADVYHIHDPNLLLIVKKLKRMNKKIIYDSHEYYPIQIKSKPYLNKFTAFVYSSAYTLIENKALKYIDAVILPCTINNGNNPYAWKVKHTAIIDNLPIKEEINSVKSNYFKRNEGIVCYVGSLTKDRGIKEIILASYKANVKLILAGAFHEKKFENELRNMEEFSCVDFRGYVGRNEVLSLISNSDIGLCILHDSGQYSIGDNLPTKAYEYLGLGKPIILNSSFFNDKFISHYDVGITVNAKSVFDISCAIKQLLQNKEEYLLMSNKGIQIVQNNFNWENQYTALKELYYKL